MMQNLLLDLSTAKRPLGPSVPQTEVAKKIVEPEDRFWNCYALHMKEGMGKETIKTYIANDGRNRKAQNSPRIGF